jgi:hypothetical protein
MISLGTETAATEKKNPPIMFFLKLLWCLKCIHMVPSGYHSNFYFKKLLWRLFCQVKTSGKGIPKITSPSA